MNTEIIAPASVEEPEESALRLARWMGRREAFGNIAGRCSAADIECLRQIRNQKLFKGLTRNWDEFCTQHLRLSRRKIDDDIRHLEEFGPQFFQLAQLTRITLPQYRAIAQHVTGDGIHVDSRVIALLETNAEQVAAAVQDLRNRAEPEVAPAVPMAPAADLFDAALRGCAQSAAALESKPTLDGAARAKLRRSLRRLLNAAARLAVYPAR